MAGPHLKNMLFSLLLCMWIRSTLGGEVDPSESRIWGPGLYPDNIVMPARYFYIHAVGKDKQDLQESPGDIFDIEITGDSDHKICRVWINTLDRKDGSFIVRYRMYHVCHNFQIHVKYRGVNVADSPYKISGPVYPDICYCPVSYKEWIKGYGCPNNYRQIDKDLKHFPKINVTEVRKFALEKFNHPGSMSVCNYVVKHNQIYRKCYGQYVGFKMFLDAILLSLARKLYLPDMEILFNLGDWPLMNNREEPKIPIFSWCGSDDTLDIVMPTYDITEATLECMGRVMLDMLSVQGNIDLTWNNKIEKAFWRGRDSRRERLQLIELGRKHPDLFNVSLTNFFFFRSEEKIYGPTEKHISFFKFFDYKYQINIDGTVAAYRLPYLLAGDSVVFKQHSKYYEFFYKQIKPWVHYIPFKSDLSDLLSQIKWAKEHDAEAYNISRNARKFAQENLMPKDIFCYHAVLFKEWSDRIVDEVEIQEGMEHVVQPESEKPYKCSCHRPIKKLTTQHNSKMQKGKQNGKHEEL